MAVYFARAEATTFVKIGYAANVDRRILHLQAGCPYRLKVVRVVEGDRLLEAAYHTLFADHRIDRDWFYWADAMHSAVAVVQRYTPAPRDPSAFAGSFADLIGDMGGPTIVAGRMGVPAPVVFKYRQRNRIPAKHWPAFQALGVSADKLIACESARLAQQGEGER